MDSYLNLPHKIINNYFYTRKICLSLHNPQRVDKLYIKKPINVLFTNIKRKSVANRYRFCREVTWDFKNDKVNKIA